MISSFSPVLGGAERATQTLVEALRGREHDVIVFTRRFARELAPSERIDGIPVFRLGWPGRGKLNALTFALHALVLLAWRFRDWRIVHVQNIDTPLLVGLLARVALRRKLVATIHGHTQILGRIKGKSGRLRTRMMARGVHRFTSINPDNTTALVDVGVPRSRISEIPNGVDTSVFRPPSVAERAGSRSALGLGTDEFVAVYIGRLVAWKRVDLLVRAWEGMSAIGGRRLLIVGEGPEAERLRAQGEAMGPTIRFEGRSNQPLTYLWAADVFVNASGDNRLQGEGLSVALLEAMAVGVPPVVTKGPGNDVVVEDGVTGLSFPVQDVAALGGCLSRMQQDVEFRLRSGHDAHERVSQRFSIEAVAKQLEGLYLSLDDEAAS